MENEYNQYMGNIINGLVKEASYWKHRCSIMEAELAKIKPEVQPEYIYKEHTED